jgi:hypothetical protein
MPRVGASTGGSARAGPGMRGATLARYQFSDAVSAPGRDRSAIACSRSPSPRLNVRSQAQSSCWMVASATPANWKNSWYHAISCCRRVGAARRCGTEIAVSVRTRSGLSMAVSHATAAPQSWPTTCTWSSPSRSSIAVTSATMFGSRYAATSAGRCERPNPRMSGVMTRNPLAARNGT